MLALPPGRPPPMLVLSPEVTSGNTLLHMQMMFDDTKPPDEITPYKKWEPRTHGLSGTISSDEEEKQERKTQINTIKSTKVAASSSDSDTPDIP